VSHATRCHARGCDNPPEREIAAAEEGVFDEEPEEPLDEETLEAYEHACDKDD